MQRANSREEMPEQGRELAKDGMGRVRWWPWHRSWQGRERDRCGCARGLQMDGHVRLSQGSLEINLFVLVLYLNLSLQPPSIYPLLGILNFGKQ